MVNSIGLFRRWQAAWVLLAALFLSVATLQADPASEAEASWFVGKWTVGPAPVDGFETISGGETIMAEVRHLDGARIEREIKIRGQLHVMQFEVRVFGGNFPWWGDNGGNYVSKKRDENSFVLAPVGPMGKADWKNGWLYQRLAEKED